MSLPAPNPFKIAIPDSLLSFINDRVKTARIPKGVDFPPGKEWFHGVPPSVMQHLQEYWSTKYDWRAVEAQINSHLKMFTLPIQEEGEEITMHFVHHRSEKEGAIPLIFQHGWPGSFLEVDKIIDSLVSPSDPNKQAYHVVAPSLPGFGFSSAFSSPDFSLANMASINNKLMNALGYSKYIAQGGDWGSMVSRIAGLQYPESCTGVHVNLLAAGPPSWWASPLAFLRFIAWAIWTRNQEDGLLKRMKWWAEEESGYMEIQGTKPQTISYSLVDSPLGMLAWLRDKMQPLVDKDYTWEDEEVITWAMMYIIPGSSGQASIYTNVKGDKSKALFPLLGKRLPSNVDFGASLFPKDTFNIPYFWANASIAQNIVFWRQHSSGGHFASLEKPDVLVDDIRGFTASIKKERASALKAAGKLKI